MMGQVEHGQYFFCVKVTRDLSPNGEIYLNADKVTVSQIGALEFGKDKGSGISLIIAPGKWLACYSASVWDGSAVAVEYWQGEIDRYGDDELDKPKTDNRSRSKERDKVSKSLRYDVLKRDGFRCRNCGAVGADDKLEVDHILSVAKGGKTEMDNLQTLCFTCNRGKRDKV